MVQTAFSGSLARGRRTEDFACVERHRPTSNRQKVHRGVHEGALSEEEQTTECEKDQGLSSGF
jgi:hypothetical protein